MIRTCSVGYTTCGISRALTYSQEERRRGQVLQVIFDTREKLVVARVPRPGRHNAGGSCGSAARYRARQVDHAVFRLGAVRWVGQRGGWCADGRGGRTGQSITAGGRCVRYRGGASRCWLAHTAGLHPDLSGCRLGSDHWRLRNCCGGALATVRDWGIAAGVERCGFAPARRPDGCPPFQRRPLPRSVARYLWVRLRAAPARARIPPAVLDQTTCGEFILSAARRAASMRSSGKGLPRNAIAPCSSALLQTSASGFPETKITGTGLCIARSLRCRSSPLVPGSRTSNITQSVSLSLPESRTTSRDANAAHLYAKDRKKL